MCAVRTAAREACYRGTGNREVYTHDRRARPLPILCILYTQTGRDTLAKWSARSRDASRSRHRHRNLLAYASSPSNGQVLRFSVDSPQCHSVFLADARDPRVSFRSTHSASTNPSFPSAAFLRLLFASSCKKLPLNLYIERRVDDDFSYRNSSRLGLQLTRFS
jgi:hypothetical protein